MRQQVQHSGRRMRSRLPSFLGPSQPLLVARGGNDIMAEMGGGAAPFVMLNQQAKNWCWAAVIQSVLAARNVRDSQEAIVKDHTAKTCPTTAPPKNPTSACTPSDCPNACNAQHTLRVALAGRGLMASVIPLTPRPQALQSIRRELAAGRPVAARIAQPVALNQTGHFVLLAECETNGSNPLLQMLSSLPVKSAPMPVGPIGVRWNDLLNGFAYLSGPHILTHLYATAA